MNSSGCHIPRGSRGTTKMCLALFSSEVTTFAFAEERKHGRVQVLAVHDESGCLGMIPCQHRHRSELGVGDQPEDRCRLLRGLVADQPSTRVPTELPASKASQPDTATSSCIHKLKRLPLSDGLCTADDGPRPVAAEVTQTGLNGNVVPGCDDFKASLARLAILVARNRACKVSRSKATKPTGCDLFEVERLAQKRERRIVRE
mmetsp:Transcript_26194/g.75131  ORF Transcript_26194/g.75131 Transcript_26194/m.75131 type:complete len:203 (-) Transcript_26194:275-883(-)